METGTDGNSDGLQAKKRRLGDHHGAHAHNSCLTTVVKHVMENIGRSLVAKELLDLRQTCTAWNAGFIPPLRTKHSPIKLTAKEGSEYDGNGKRAGDRTSAEVLREYVDLMKGSKGIPFGSHRLEVISSWIEVGVGDPEEWNGAFEELVKLTGRSLTFLDIVWNHEALVPVNQLYQLVFEKLPALSAVYIQPCGYSGSNSNVDLDARDYDHGNQPLFVMHKTLPSLKRIKVRKVHFDHLSNSIVKFVCNVMASAEHLNYLAVPFPHDDSHGFTATLLKTLQQNPRPLKTLKIAVQAAAQLTSLVQLGLCLEKLCLAVVWFRTSTVAEAKEKAALFYKFLGSQGTTLRTLALSLEYVNLEGNGNKYGAAFRVLRMDGLRTLKRLDVDQQQRGQSMSAPTPVPDLAYATSIKSTKDLRQLRDFTLVGPSHGSMPGSLDSPGFTNFGAYHGLALAGPLLKRVSILGPNGETGKHKISERCYAYLQKVLGEDAVIKI